MANARGKADKTYSDRFTTDAERVTVVIDAESGAVLGPHNLYVVTGTVEKIDDLDTAMDLADVKEYAKKNGRRINVV